MTVLTRQVGASSDDCWRRLQVSPGFTLDDPNQAVGYYSSTGYAYGGGMRFTNITIPRGARIVTAHLTLRCRTAYAGTTVNSRISASDEDDAVTFSTAEGFDARFSNHTTARVNWDNIPAWTKNVDYNSIDFKAVIQEIVDRGGWNSGQAIIIFWEDFDDRSTHASYRVRFAYSYDSSITYAPKLHIEYTTVIYEDLSGSSAGVASVSGSIKRDLALSGLSAGIALVSGSIKRKLALAGLSQGVASVSGFTRVRRTLAGISSGKASVSGTLERVKELSGAAAGVALVTGSIAITRALAGISAGVATVTGRLEFIKWLSGVSAGVATVTGNLTRVTMLVKLLHKLIQVEDIGGGGES